MLDVGRMIATEDRSMVEKWMRAHTQVAYCGKHTVLCRVLGQYKMYLDARDTAIAPHLMLDGCWEMWISQAVARHVRPGMRCIDVGANFGYYTLLLAHLVGDGGTGYVDAWEARPETATFLRKTCQINGLTGRVDVVGAAATDREADGMKLIEVTNDLGGVKTRHWSDAERLLRGSTPVSQVVGSRLDAQADEVDFIKIDVEGHEAQVWAGMERIIQMSPNLTVLMEFNPGEVDEPAAFLELIQSQGFTLGTVTTDGFVAPVTLEQALQPDSGPLRMLWLSRPKV